MNTVKAIAKSLGKKAIIVLVGLIMAVLREKFPGWPLPSDQLIIDAVAALLLTHTATDIVYILKTFGKEAVKEIAPKL